MKSLKVFLAATIICGSSLGIAQMRPGIEAGANYSTISMSDQNGSDLNYLLGYHVRGVAEFVLTDLVSIETGFGYSAKGYSYKNEFSFTLFGVTSTTTNEGHTRLNYLNLPVLAKFGTNVGDGRLYLGVGPDLYFAASGKNKSTTTQTVGNSSTVNTNESTIDWKNDEISRFDVGAKGVLGYEKNGMFVEAGFEHGFINLNTDNNIDNTLLNQNITLTLGFKLGGY